MEREILLEGRRLENILSGRSCQFNGLKSKALAFSLGLHRAVCDKSIDLKVKLRDEKAEKQTLFTEARCYILHFHICMGF